VANNVLEYGTGAINVGGCRVGSDIIKTNGKGTMGGSTPIVPQNIDFVGKASQGRWPANLIHDGSEEATGIFPDDAGRFFYCPKASREEREEGLSHRAARNVNDGRKTSIDNAYQRGDTQRRNIHPTVKPIALMRYLCRLITPPGGVFLYPFMGSGTTGAAAAHEGLDFIGVELSPEYHEIAVARIEYHRSRAERNRNGQPEPTEIDGLPQLTLF